MALFNNDSNMTGIYRGKITKPDNKNNKKRLYIPSIHSINPYEYEDDKFEEALQLLPEARFDTPEPPQDNMSCYIVFEGGNIKYPVVVGFLGDEIQKTINSGSSKNITGNDNINQDGKDFSTDSPNSLGWIWPTSVKTQTSGYGPRNVSVGSSNHAGIDIGTPMNTPVFAAKDGVVKKVGWNDGYGNNIDILHDNGTLLSRYAHLNSFNVKVGDNVVCGQQIALSGNTGVGSGPHLHFEIRDPNIGGGYGFKGSFNPRNYVNP